MAHDPIADPRRTPLAGLRPYLTAGVAVLGAGMIAVAPVVSDDIAADIQHRAVDLVVSDYAVNPIQTWIDIFPLALQNIESLVHTWLEMPAPVAQQVAANWVEYASQYVGDYQKAASGFVNYYGGDTGLNFTEQVQTALTALTSGNYTTGIEDLFHAFFLFPLIDILYPLERIPAIPGQILTNLANGYNNLSTTGLTVFGEWALTAWPEVATKSIGYSLQNINDAWGAGDPMGVLSNVLNIPGQLVGFLINGDTVAGTGREGFLSAPTALYPSGVGVLSNILQTIMPGLATAIYTPGGQNIAEGGSLTVAVQDFVTQLTSGWPAPGEFVNSLDTAANAITQLISGYIKFLLGNLGGSAAATPAAFSGMTDFASVMPAASTISADLVSAADLSGLSSLSVLPADVASMLGGLGGDLASVFNPAALLGMLPF